MEEYVYARPSFRCVKWRSNGILAIIILSILKGLTALNPVLTRRRRIWLTLLLGTVSATGPLAIDLYLPALPQMKAQFATTASLMQLSITACLIGLALGQLIAGPLSDQYGRRKPLIIGFVIFGLVSLAMAFIHSVTLLIALRFIQGLAGATGQVLARAVARDLFSGKKLTRFYALLNTVNGVFPIIAPIIGGFMIQYVDWEAIFILLALIGLLIALAVTFGLHESLPPEKRQTGGFHTSLLAMGKLVVQPSFWPLILATGLVYGGLFSYISASTFVFQTGFGMAPQTFSLLYAFNGLGIVVGSNLPGRLAGRFSNRQHARNCRRCQCAFDYLAPISRQRVGGQRPNLITGYFDWRTVDTDRHHHHGSSHQQCRRRLRGHWLVAKCLWRLSLPAGRLIGQIIRRDGHHALRLQRWCLWISEGPRAKGSVGT